MYRKPTSYLQSSRVLRPGGVLFVSVPMDLDIPMHSVVFSSPSTCTPLR